MTLGSITHGPEAPHHWFIQDGPEATGSYSEVQNGIVVQARIGTLTLPEYALKNMREVG